MKNSILAKRSSGILAHISSLPSPFGIGDLGQGSRDFIAFLNKAKQSIWQILPLGPTESTFYHSPYMSCSAFAGNPLFISLQDLVTMGLLAQHEIPRIDASPYTVEFNKVIAAKKNLLKKASTRFSTENEDYQQFISESPWLESYSLYMALKEKHNHVPWYSWKKDIASFTKDTVKHAKKELTREMQYYQIEQFLFHSQWKTLHSFAKQHHIHIFGDIPIYVSLDSADVWANQKIFQLSEDSQPIKIAGVPPDYFSKTGQKWGNPLYRWNSRDSSVRHHLYTWWKSRFSAIFSRVDLARIDHFRGFEKYWSVPAEAKTAENGKWENGPGAQFFKNIFQELGPLPIVAEDLGEITEEVYQLRDQFNFPGMKVLQFAFDGNSNNSFLPCNYESANSVVYTGTHDNDTTVGWYLGAEIDDTVRQRVKSYANRSAHDDRSIHLDLIYLALSSIAKTAIFPLQDILGFGSDCRRSSITYNITIKKAKIQHITFNNTWAVKISASLNSTGKTEKKWMQPGGNIHLTFSCVSCKYAAPLAPSSSGQDVGLSRRKQGFDSPWGHHIYSAIGFTSCIKKCLYEFPDSYIAQRANFGTISAGRNRSSL